MGNGKRTVMLLIGLIAAVVFFPLMFVFYMAFIGHRISRRFAANLNGAARGEESRVNEKKAFHTSDPDGPYPVGVRIEKLDFDGEDMPIVIWYPARDVEGANPHVFESGVEGSAVFGAPPDNSGAPYPLVVYMPGPNTVTATIFYNQNLASHGYVVVAIEHWDSRHSSLVVENGNWKNFIRYLPRMIREFFVTGNPSDAVLINLTGLFRVTEFGLKYRPREVALVIDNATEWTKDSSSFLQGMIDPEAIGVTGHSLGGWTSLYLGGMSFRHNDNLCADGRLDSICIADFDPGCTESVRLSGPFAFKEDRIKAILPLAPPIFQRDIALNAAEVRTPMMIMTGDSKRWESTLRAQKEVYDNVRSPKHMVYIKDVDHFTITDMMMAWPVLKWLPSPKLRANFMEKAQGYKDYSTAFFNRYLKGDESTKAVLEAPNQHFVSQVLHESGDPGHFEV